MKNLEHEKRIVTENTRLATFRNGLALCAAIAVATAAFTAHAAWTYDAEAKTLSDGNYSFSAKVVTKTDPSNNQSVTGFEVKGTTVGSGDLDFTNVGTDMTGDYAGYNVISLKQDATKQDGTEIRFVNKIESCTTLTAPHVLELDSYLFFKNGYLKEIVLSDGDEVKVTEIPERCFNTETSVLEKITPTKFPYVKTITTTFTFKGSKALKGDFSFPNMTCIGNGAFMDTAITGFSAPKLEEFEDSYGAFRGCSSLTGDLYFAELKYVGNSAFYGASKITSFVAPKATYVMQYGFASATSLTNVQLAANVTSYANSAFTSCQNLETFSPMPIVLSDLANTYDDKGNMQSLSDPFQDCNKLVGTIEISSKEKLMLTGSWMKNCKAITNVTIKAEVTNVAQYVFQNVGPGATIYWDSEKAPTSFGASAFSPEGGKHFARIYVKNDLDGWAKLLSKKAADFTTADKEKTGYPGKKTLGLINGNVYVVKDGVSGMMILIR